MTRDQGLSKRTPRNPFGCSKPSAAKKAARQTRKKWTPPCPSFNRGSPPLSGGIDAGDAASAGTDLARGVACMGGTQSVQGGWGRGGGGGTPPYPMAETPPAAFFTANDSHHHRRTTAAKIQCGADLPSSLSPLDPS